MYTSIYDAGIPWGRLSRINYSGKGDNILYILFKLYTNLDKIQYILLLFFGGIIVPFIWWLKSRVSHFLGFPFFIIRQLSHEFL